MSMTVGKVGIFLSILLSLTYSAECFIINRNGINDFIEEDLWSIEEISLINRPIIGILAQEISPYLEGLYGRQYKSYIASSYVKFVEGAGGRVVPIMIGQSTTYYRNILSKINGVLWPGGSAPFDGDNGFADAGYKIYQIAKEINNAGDYFPILGICLGFELLTYVTAHKTENRISCNSQQQPLPLTFKRGYKQSRLFNDLPSDIDTILHNESVTINFHKYCVTEKTLENAGLANDFRILSTNRDLNGTRFISTLEHKTFPFYGLQFHPEKNIYEWKRRKNIPHTPNAVRVSQYFANFFVNEARKNRHHFPNSNAEATSLIYNFSPLYTGLNGSAYQQCYLFP